MIRKYTHLLTLLLLTLLISSCSFPPNLEQLLPAASDSAGQKSLVEITFKVTVPANTPENETIYLSTLDEVTGLGVNAEAHQMNLEPDLSGSKGSRIYTATLTVPQFSVLKYRYTRINQYAVIEHTETDQQVRYRMAYADNNQIVQDVVNRWSDTDYDWPEPGRISGQITDENSGEPIPGVLVSAGGLQTHTTANGSFLLSGLPPGVHNLVVYAIDGAFQISQQGAEVASQANTEAILGLTPSEYVDITFLVSVPFGTPENSVHLAGNLYQLGNTFGNLSGGMNTIPERMPELAYAGDNRYGIILSLPVGAEIRYKYTLGDGFWNAEHNQDGSFRVRRMLVPEQPMEINDTVETWSDGDLQALTFDVYTPENTPPEENVFIQFNPYGWTTPLPMMKIDQNHWVYILYSPFDIISDLSYRYCRAGECGIADDAETMGADSGRPVQPSNQPQYIADTISSWAFLDPEIESFSFDQPASTPRDNFLTGIELLPGSDPGYYQDVLPALKVGSSINSDWIFLTPTWSFQKSTPPVFQPNPNQDPLWFDVEASISAAQGAGLKTALNPQPSFPENQEVWWQSAARDFSWWNSWFDQYALFANHFAETAEKLNVDMLILGGVWLEPALPAGRLPGGDPSGVPADAHLRWNKILEEVNNRYSGTIVWNMSLPGQASNLTYLENVDRVLLNFSPPLTENTESSPDQDQMNSAVKQYLSNRVQPFHENQLEGKSLILRVAYPSVNGGSSNCIPAGENECYPLQVFEHPAPDIDDLTVDYAEQASAYQAVFSTVKDLSWVDGVVSQGYYAPAILHDYSISIHGKSAEEVLQFWFSQLSP